MYMKTRKVNTHTSKLTAKQKRLNATKALVALGGGFKGLTDAPADTYAKSFAKRQEEVTLGLINENNGELVLGPGLARLDDSSLFAIIDSWFQDVSPDSPILLCIMRRSVGPKGAFPSPWTVSEDYRELRAVPLGYIFTP